MPELIEVSIEKIVHGGQGLATLPDGRKVFVWNALPGEEVGIRLIKQKRSYAEAIADEILKPAADRVPVREDNYLATSPWQIMAYESENRYKKQIITELFEHENVPLPAGYDIVFPEQEWRYRNKMEYSFWGDDDGLRLALHRRGSHGKQIVGGSELAQPAIDVAANTICTQLNTLGARAGDLKTVVVRCNKKGETVAALFVKPQTFPKLELPTELKGLRVYHSNPKSPASVTTQLLYELGEATLVDDLLDQSFTYDVDSFYQVNPPIFEQALTRIKEYCSEPRVIDMYAGVGSIGLSVALSSADLIELDSATAAMARLNAATSHIDATVVEASTEKALDYIAEDVPAIFDPPRAGLHDKVVERVLEVLPPKVIYLSCNPATQARDLAKLQEKFKVTFFEIYNFFPKTPHIETLAILERSA